MTNSFVSSVVLISEYFIDFPLSMYIFFSAVHLLFVLESNDDEVIFFYSANPVCMEISCVLYTADIMA